VKELITVQTLFDKQIVGATAGDLWFHEVDKSTADKIIIQYHYSHKPTSNSFVSLLVNDGKGVLQLGYGIRPQNKGALREICTDGNWCEFDRMWLSDELPKFSESRIISLLFFYLKFRFPKIMFVITYADESAGNKGIIYQATNAIELEGREVDFYILPSGERIHPVTMWHRHKTRAKETLEKIYPGIVHVKGTRDGVRQRKYIYALNKRGKKLLSRVLAGNLIPHAPDIGNFVASTSSSLPSEVSALQEDSVPPPTQIM